MIFLPLRRDRLEAQPEDVFDWLVEQKPQHDGRCYVRTSVVREKFGNSARAFYGIVSELAACGQTQVERWRLESLQPGAPRHGFPPARQYSGQWDVRETLYVLTPINPLLLVTFETYVAKAGTFPALRKGLRELLWNNGGRRCAYCEADVSLESYQVDHKIPKARGGLHQWDNLAVACFTCNGAKGASTPEEFARRRRRA